MEQKPWFFHSITFHVVFAIFLLLLPFVFLSVYISQQFIAVNIEQVEQANIRLLEQYMAQLDREMELAENEMNTLICYNSATVYLTDRSSANFYYAVNDVKRELANNALYYQYIDGFFISAPGSGFLYAYGAPEWEPPEGLTKEWQYMEPYLIQGYSSNGICGGAFFDPAKLAAEDGVRFCLEEQLGDIELSGKNKLLYIQSDKCSLCAYKVLDQREALSALPFILQYLQAATLFFLLLIPLAFLSQRRLVIRPLHRLTAAMEQLESGDLDTQLDNKETIREFYQIGDNFNRMARQIKSLKIDLYEEQLATEKVRTQNLTYQLRPHFMINSLNMAYNLILSKDYDSASKLMRFSASYMRYLLHIENDFVPLKEEMEHLQDYMNIQLLRYEGQFKYETEVDPFVEDIDIPSMVLQNFIENSIKYSIGPDHFTTIRLTARYCELDESPYAVIVVRDDGNGYPVWFLDALAAGNQDVLRDRVGLRNTIQRIELLYKGQAQYRFYNNNGAVSQFIFPLDTAESWKP